MLTSRQALSALLFLTLLLQATAITSGERVARILARYLDGSTQLRRRAPSQNIYNTRFDNVTWDNDNWRVTTTNLDQGHYQSRMTVSNGLLGINVAATGPFFEIDLPGKDVF